MLLCLFVQFAQMVQSFRDFFLKTVRSRSIKPDLWHSFRQIILSGGVCFRFVMRIPVAMPETQLLHQKGGCVSQMFRDRPRLVASYESSRFIIRKIGGIALVSRFVARQSFAPFVRIS